MKKITVLGSTGSIGTGALSVIEHLGPDYKVIGLAARSNARVLLKQAFRHRPKWVMLFEPSAASAVRGKLPKGTALLPSGIDSMMEMSAHPESDLVINSLAGSVGFAPLVAAIKSGKRIALANKEPMVMAGETLMKEARRWNAEIIPVDSEPSAIFQCMQSAIPGGIGKRQSLKQSGAGQAGGPSPVSRIFLTASGGPFYKKKGPLDGVTPREALTHPNWKMGAKITVDCATLMNKGLEAIEIQNLFSIPLSKINILIHPQSIMHSAVEFSDGSVLAQMSVPDMRLPIQYAITYPERKASVIKPIDFFAISGSRLDFAPPDTGRFPCLGLALEAGRRGGTYPAVLNAADEAAVSAFLNGRLPFTGIAAVVETLLDIHKSQNKCPSLADVVEADQWARARANEIIMTFPRTVPLFRRKRALENVGTSL